MKTSRRFKDHSFIVLLAGIAWVGGISAAVMHPAVEKVYGTWIVDGEVCFLDCGPGLSPRYAEFKGQKLILGKDRYENPLDGPEESSSTCKAGVDLSAVRLRDGIKFVLSRPVESLSEKPNRRNPEEFGVTHAAIPAGIIACVDGFNLATVLLPAENRLLVEKEGGDFVSFHRWKTAIANP